MSLKTSLDLRKYRITQFLNDHRLDKPLEEHYLSSLFDPNETIRATIMTKIRMEI